MTSRFLYPIPDDFLNELEQDEPSLFNYVCLSGKQLFFDISRSKYRIFTAGWFPSFKRPSDTYFIEKYHTVFEDKSFEACKLMFRRCLADLSQRFFSADLELF